MTNTTTKMHLVEREFRLLNRFVSFFIYTFIVIIIVFVIVLFVVEKSDILVVSGIVELDGDAQDYPHTPNVICLLRCAVSERDVLKIKPGQKASVAFSVLPSVTHRMYEGTVITVSSQPITPSIASEEHIAGGAFYGIDIKLDEASLDGVFRTAIKQRMIGKAQIEIDKKALYRFLWEKLFKKDYS